MDHLAKLRRDYEKQRLDEGDAGDDPHALFLRWLADARAASVPDPTAMTLATVTDGKPSARVVLLKGAEDGHFVFYTNMSSQKARELLENPHAALVFFWPELERQVRVEGTAVRVSDAAADAYFALRPRESQLGAWASAQSSVVADRVTLEAAFDAARARYEGAVVPRPPFWSGFAVEPAVYEFWQGRASRLHDRLRYERAGAVFRRVRLQP